MTNSIIANNGRQGIDSADASVGRPTTFTITDTTLFNNTPDQINNSSTIQGIDISNTILAGSGKTGINNAGNPISINYSALVNAGPNALTTLTTGAGTTTIGAQVINADPEFISTNPTSSDFLDVASLLYATAGTGGNPLKGGADYVVITKSQIWNIY